jgi:DNA (cytosine-5)-methyltransferase 1
MLLAVWNALVSRLRHPRQTISAIDPFAGDGRLIAWLLEIATEAGYRDLLWRVGIWDIDEEALKLGQRLISQYAAVAGIEVDVCVRAGDSFAHGYETSWDAVVTNPPWELLKPDSRELEMLPEVETREYVDAMRDYDSFLGEKYPRAQPARRFAGWGTNLSRVGIDLADRLTRQGGVLGMVVPASFLADDNSLVLRRSLLTENTLVDAAYFPAEARLFGKADVAAATVVFAKETPEKVEPRVTAFDATLRATSSQPIHLRESYLTENRWSVPISFAAPAIDLLGAMAKHRPLSTLEGKDTQDLWAGRELDETRIGEFLAQAGSGLFVKGRMISRFEVVETPSEEVLKPGWLVPESVNFERIAWRDVTRPNQKRRMIATLIPAGWIAGNSLGVAYFRDGSAHRLRILLGLMSSMCFELQLRSFLATGHVSVTALRKVRIPDINTLPRRVELIEAVEDALTGDTTAEARIEALVAMAYGLTLDELAIVIDQFPKVDVGQRQQVLATFAEYASTARGADIPSLAKASIPNHKAATLSKLDLEMISSVPPGGNWKQIPLSIPSKRLDQIRKGFQAGNGSRSTYYGRLHPDRPSYTINTNFNRPGNGCHIHYDIAQNRVLSQREAARLQSFPDNFVFVGTQGDVNTQIGNAVPPLLAYQIATSLDQQNAQFLELFCGAGGMGLGFKWAGWKPVIASDLVSRFTLTYAINVHSRVVAGDLNDDEVFSSLVSAASAARLLDPSRPLWVLGGPPCQGFSTAGNRRSMDDPRNRLVWRYREFLDVVRPVGFVFENVTGLLNMNGGRMFDDVLGVLGEGFDSVRSWVLAAEEYGIPQRRSRVFILASQESMARLDTPEAVTTMEPESQELFMERRRSISTREALSDLPPLEPGEDGSAYEYRSEPATNFQRFVRGLSTPEDFLDTLRRPRVDLAD